MKQHKLVNEYDKKECLQIGSYIDEYEKKSNIKVKKVAFVYDQRNKAFYDNIENKSSIQLRALYGDWSTVGALNFYNNRHLEKVKMKLEIYAEYFDMKNWDKLDKEQFVFIDDTLYIYKLSVNDNLFWKYTFCFSFG